MKGIQIVYVYISLLCLILCKHGEKHIYKTSLYTTPMNPEESLGFSSYIGMTYDIIKGNPYGDPVFVSDLGYRKYVFEVENYEVKVHTSFNNKNIKISSSYSSMKSPNILCYHSKKPSVLHGLEDLTKEFSIVKFPPQYDIHPSNNSNLFKILYDRMNEGDSILIQKVICSNYFMSVSNFTAFMDPIFLNALNGLAENYQEIKGDTMKCNVHYFKLNPKDEQCEKNVNPWIRFFNIYGTHLITGGYFGGKIINILYANDNSFNPKNIKMELYGKRLSPFYISSQLFFFGALFSKRRTTFLKEKTVILHGGADKEDILKKFNSNSTNNNSFNFWKESISKDWKLAKPTKLLLTPLAYFIKSDKGKESYYNALEFYSSLTYSEYNQSIFELSRSKKSFYIQRIKNWKQVVNKNTNVSVHLECPNESHMLSGFIITNKKKMSGDSITMHVCPAGKECISDIPIETDDSFELGWILCTGNYGQTVRQVKQVTKGKGSATCPPNMKIGYGFSMVIKKGISSSVIVAPCTSNRSTCELSDVQGDTEGIIWITCFSKQDHIFLKTLETKTFFKNLSIKKETSFRLDCSPNNYIIAGFAVDFSSSEVSESTICPVGSFTCDFKIELKNMGQEETHNPFIFMACSSL